MFVQSITSNEIILAGKFFIKSILVDLLFKLGGPLISINYKIWLK